MSSKTACRKRQREANRRKHAKQRKLNYLLILRYQPRHAADREWEMPWQNATVTVATLATGAAAVFAVGVPVSGHVFPGSPLAAYSPWSPSEPGSPAAPHLPEPEMTFYAAYDGASTATTTTRMPTPGMWAAWEWTQAYGSMGLYGD